MHFGKCGGGVYTNFLLYVFLYFPHLNFLLLFNGLLLLKMYVGAYETSG